MNNDILVLRAIVRLSRARKDATSEALLQRCSGGAAAIRGSLRRLAAMGLVERVSSDRVRLTLSGLAVGVASLGVKANRRALRRAA